MVGRRIENINNIDNTNDIITNKKLDDDFEDEEQRLIQMLTLGLRTISEVRHLCLRSNENFVKAEQLQKKADQVYFEAERHRQRYRLRRGKIDRFKETFHREMGFRYEHSAQMRLRTAFKELKTAYDIVNKDGKRDLPDETESTIVDVYDKAFGFLHERYGRSMTHVGAGRLPSFRGYRNGKKANLYLGKIISDRQLKLMTTVMTEIEEDVKNSRMAAAKRLYLQYAIPLAVSFRTFHRGNVLDVQ